MQSILSLLEVLGRILHSFMCSCTSGQAKCQKKNVIRNMFAELFATSPPFSRSVYAYAGFFDSRETGLVF